MSIHTLGGVNYSARRGLPGVENSFSSWFCRWELPTRNGGPTEIQMHGDWMGPAAIETDAVRMAQEDFAGSAAEPEYVNTEFLNDR